MWHLICLLLASQQADVGTEFDAWHHQEAASTPDAMALRPAAALRRRFIFQEVGVDYAALAADFTECQDPGLAGLDLPAILRAMTLRRGESGAFEIGPHLEKSTCSSAGLGAGAPAAAATRGAAATRCSFWM